MRTGGRHAHQLTVGRRRALMHAEAPANAVGASAIIVGFGFASATARLTGSNRLSHLGRRNRRLLRR